MAGHNRYLAGPTNAMLVPVRGQTVVETGDFMWRYDDNDAESGFITARSADFYGYPISSISSSCSGLKRVNLIDHSRFLGIAMDGSPSGTTEDIAVATTGEFRYQIYNLLHRSSIPSAVTDTSNVTVGMTVSLTSPPANQYVQQGGTAAGTSAYIGYCSKTESGASFIDFFLRSHLGPAAQI